MPNTEYPEAERGAKYRIPRGGEGCQIQNTERRRGVPNTEYLEAERGAKYRIPRGGEGCQIQNT